MNHREWLDLRFSTVSRLPTLSDGMQAMTIDELQLELAEGGFYEGFEFATVEDVHALAMSAGAKWFAPPDTRISFSLPPTEDSVELLGWNIGFEGGVIGPMRFAYGQVATSEGELIGSSRFDGTIVTAQQFERVIPGRPDDPRDFIVFAPRFKVEDEPWPLFADVGRTAFWLYRDAIPIPEPVAFTPGLVLGLLTLRRRCSA